MNLCNLFNNKSREIILQNDILDNFDFISKTVSIDETTVIAGVDVATHCKIVATVASLLCSLNKNKSLFPFGTDFIAACHDVGKISPDFQKMIYQHLTNYDSKKYPQLARGNVESAKRVNMGFHAKVSQVCLADYGTYFSTIVGVHHGFKPNSLPYKESVYGGQAWTNKRHELIKKLSDYCHVKEGFIPPINSFEQACVIAGLVTVADWIGSGGEFSSLTGEENLSNQHIQEMAQRAVKQAGFVPLEIQHNLSFQSIFDFEPRKTQETFFQKVKVPGVYILEAPMGLGKTEAALFASYQILETGHANGIYFALPTQLTSQKVYERFNKFLEKICLNDNVQKAKLVHSSAWLQDDIFGEDGAVGGSWFNDKKRRILAPFAVGTIDQALMAVMNVKHGFVRTFGLAGKVVILDEVHSYDTYTGSLLYRLISCLRKIGCTVILLSATLTSEQKRKLLSSERQTVFKTEYPLITFQRGASSSQKIEEISAKEDHILNVKIRHTSDENFALNIALKKAEEGEQVLWIENTVDEAQAIYKKIGARIDRKIIECGLLHSRFLQISRKNNENYWVSLYGKNAGDERYKKGRILIGTQVLEQSLDIDADFLITRICPSDMLLQRMGRMWRHIELNAQRPKGAEPYTLILSPRYKDAVSNDNCFGTSAFVYSEYVLCRTLEIWSKKTNIILPTEIREVLEATYSDRQETGRLARLVSELQEEKEKLQSMAAIGMAKEGQTLPEIQVKTRFSERETVDVLLIKSIQKISKARKLIFLDNSEQIIPIYCQSSQEKRAITRHLMENTVRVDIMKAPKSGDWLNWLRPYVYIGKNEDDLSSPFRIAKVKLDDSLVLLEGGQINDAYELNYTKERGYETKRRIEKI